MILECKGASHYNQQLAMRSLLPSLFSPKAGKREANFFWTGVDLSLSEG